MLRYHTVDELNSIFELGGSLMAWSQVIAVHRDNGYSGNRLTIVAFFLMWGIWNLFYYRTLDQPISFIAGVSICLANISLLALMVYYGKRG